MVEFLGKEFKISSLPSDRLTGVKIERNRCQRTIHLSQPDYVKTIPQSFDMVTVTLSPSQPIPASNCHHLCVSELKKKMQWWSRFLSWNRLTDSSSQFNMTWRHLCQRPGSPFFSKPWTGTVERTKKRYWPTYAKPLIMPLYSAMAAKSLRICWRRLRRRSTRPTINIRGHIFSQCWPHLMG